MAMFQNVPCGVKWFWGSIGDIPYPRLLVMTFTLELDRMGETEVNWRWGQGEGTGWACSLGG